MMVEITMNLKSQMNRRRFLAAASSAALIAAGPAQAAYEQDLIQQLKSQGYSGITVSSTLLGRTRIIARKKGGVREIILNPRTGEILRDLWTGADGSQKSPTLVKSGNGNSGTDDDGGSDDDGGDDDGGSDDDDNGSDDDTDSDDDHGGSDDEGDDNSGSGGGSGGGDDDGGDDSDDD